MKDEQIRELIRNSISDIRVEVANAKVDIAESRLRHLTIVGAIIVGLTGVVVPILLTSSNTSRVDTAISEMNAKFDKLAAIQLRQPDIHCLGNGKPIENSSVSLDPKSEDFMLELLNTGSGSAYSVETFLYFDSKDSIFVSNWGIGWYPHQTSDDPNFSQQFEYTGAHNFNAKRTWALKTRIQIFAPAGTKIGAKLKVYSLDSGPWEFPFTVVKK
jgi:hypothetical protein